LRPVQSSNLLPQTATCVSAAVEPLCYKHLAAIAQEFGLVSHISNLGAHLETSHPLLAYSLLLRYLLLLYFARKGSGWKSPNSYHFRLKIYIYIKKACGIAGVARYPYNFSPRPSFHTELPQSSALSHLEPQPVSRMPNYIMLQILCFANLSSSDSAKPFDPDKMCEYTKNYYIYTSCVDPGAHFFGTSVDGKREHRCPRGPHERYIVVPGHCPLCNS
jgi:hypothetical protein